GRFKPLACGLDGALEVVKFGLRGADSQEPCASLVGQAWKEVAELKSHGDLLCGPMNSSTVVFVPAQDRRSRPPLPPRVDHGDSRFGQVEPVPRDERQVVNQRGRREEAVGPQISRSAAGAG